MANKDMVKGAEPCGRIYEFQVYKAEGTIYPGDFLKKNSNGTVEQAAAGNAIIGVAMNYAAASSEVLVADHPDQLFVIQAAASEIDAQTDIGLCADITVASGNSSYKRSGMELDGSTAQAGTGQLKIVRIDRSVDNALGANCKCVVRINEHQNGVNVDGI